VLLRRCGVACLRAPACACCRWQRTQRQCERAQRTARPNAVTPTSHATTHAVTGTPATSTSALRTLRASHSSWASRCDCQRDV
jgi:hypothetical protein